jgi:carbon storage regulator
MLILSRKFNESIIIDGRIVVKVVRLDSDVVKLGIDAPMDVPVHRQEIFDEIQRNNREALMQTRPPVPRLNTAMFCSPIPATPPVAAAPAPPPTPSKPVEADDLPAPIKAAADPKTTVTAAAAPKSETRKKTRTTRTSKPKSSANPD